MEVAVFVRILAFWGLFNSIANPAGILMVAKGRTDLGFYWTVVRIFIVTAAIVIACQFSIVAVAYAQTAVAIAFLFLYWRLMVYKMSFIPLKNYILSFLRPLLISAALGVPFYFTTLISDNIIYQFAMMAAYGLAVLGAYWIFDKEYLKELKTLILSR